MTFLVESFLLVSISVWDISRFSGFLVEKKSNIVSCFIIPRSLLPATLMNIRQILEGRSQKVSIEEPNLDFVHGLLTSYHPCRSKTMFFDLNPKGAKL